jgi:CheY-like chemotaxis protein/CHASE3 domain sensor protein
MSSDAHSGTLLKRRLTFALAVPIGLLVALGVVLGSQLMRMAKDAEWVDHSDQVLAKVSAAMGQVSDQESGLRAYLLSGDKSYVEPSERARPRDELTQLRDLVTDNPVQQARVEEATRRYDAWYEYVSPILSARDLTVARGMDSMRERKARMDAFRTTVREAADVEEKLRRGRVATAAESARATRTLFVTMFAITALVLAFVSRKQLRAIAGTYATALGAERAVREKMEMESWVRAGQAKLAEAMQGEASLEQLAAACLGMLAPYAGANVAALYTRDGGGWRRRGGHALDTRAAGPETFAAGQGVVGLVGTQTTLTHLRDVPADFLKVRSGTGERTPVEVVLVPACVDGHANAVIELGYLRPAPAEAIDLLGRVGAGVALAVRSAEYKQQLRDLLEESQRQGEELQTQQEELRVTNEELQNQGTALSEAHAHLEERQRALEEGNTRLEEHASELLRSREEVAARAAEVAQASRYKSEFLANMSHELRTPLNSTLILAKLLADNRDGNLTAEQIRFAETIYAAGNDLLSLIADILDLSKIESGKVDVRAAPIDLARLADTLSRTFEPMARDKNLAFSITTDASAPARFDSDLQRVEQILKNLVANAVKFTEKGKVSLTIGGGEGTLELRVEDTGIGIPKAQQELIFEAFRQADSGATRKYGGTGLGLSISRDLARLLGGELRVESEAGRGSAFILTLPVVYTPRALSRPPPPMPSATHAPRLARSDRPAAPASRRQTREVDDDAGHLDASRRLVLVVEDDVVFAKILVDIAHELEFQCIVAQGADEAFDLARRHRPRAVLLDVGLPDHSGLSVLDRLKRDPTTRHIPVHVVSGSDYAQTALAMGAIGYMKKPAQRDELVQAFRALEQRFSSRIRRLLLVEDDDVQRASLEKLLGGPDTETVAVGTVAEALEQLGASSFDCVVTDLTLPDASGFELLERMAGDSAYSFPPVIVYTGRSLTKDEEQRLRRYSSSIIVKGARSPERLLDEVSLFLHQVEADLPPERQRMLRQARDREALFEGRRILIVEDDVRNIFALTSVLEPKGAKILIARNGLEALKVLAAEPQVDLVLMDIMMPEMDGLEATREIRKQARWAKLPIVALTAKAMKDDQQRCLEAGANDYVAKPLDVEMLLSLLRIWMPK